MTDTRNKTIDSFKGVAIISVVIAHAIGCAATSSTATSAMNFGSMIREYFYSGLLLFFIISGYYTKLDDAVKNNLLKRFGQIVIPMIIASIALPAAIYGMMLLQGSAGSFQTFCDYIVSTLIGSSFYDFIVPSHEPFSIYYYSVCGTFFFLQMFVLSLALFFAIGKRVTESIKTAIFTIIILLTISGILFQFNIKLPWFIESVPLVCSFMIFGAMLKKIDFFDLMNSRYAFSKKSLVTFIILTAVGMTLTFFFPTTCCLYLSVYGEYGFVSAFIFFFEMCCCAIALLTIAYVSIQIPVVRDISTFIGKHTLFIFILHMFFLKLLAVLFIDHSINPTVEIPFENTFIAIIYGVAAIILSLIVSVVINRLCMKKNANIQQS